MDDTMERSGDTSRTASFPADPASTRAARHFVRVVLRDWGFGTVETVQPAILVANELATNAIVHAGSGFELTLRHRDGVVRIEVRDNNPAEPKVTPWPEVTTRGRGMHLVGAMSATWGTTSVVGGGKVVWVELPRQEA